MVINFGECTDNYTCGVGYFSAAHLVIKVKSDDLMAPIQWTTASNRDTLLVHLGPQRSWPYCPTPTLGRSHPPAWQRCLSGLHANGRHRPLLRYLRAPARRARREPIERPLCLGLSRWQCRQRTLSLTINPGRGARRICWIGGALFTHGSRRAFNTLVIVLSPRSLNSLGTCTGHGCL